MSTQPYLDGGNVLLIGGLTDKQGLPTPSFQKFLNDLQTRVGTALGELGVLIGEISANAQVQGRAGTISAALSNITATGLLSAPSLTGLVPAVNLPSSAVGVHGAVQAINPVAHEWINSINTSGVPQLSQPAFTDISGVATAAQVPALSALTGSVTTGQLPASVIPLTGTTAALGGSAMTAGQVITANVTIAGAASGSSVIATPTTYPGNGFVWQAYISSANTVTVTLTCITAGTPTSSTYAVRVIP